MLKHVQSHHWQAAAVVNRSPCHADAMQTMLNFNSCSLIRPYLQKGLQKVDPQLLGKVPLSYFVGVLGMPGFTAWAGLKKIAEPIKKEEVALVSAAAGAVVSCGLVLQGSACSFSM